MYCSCIYSAPHTQQALIHNGRYYWAKNMLNTQCCDKTNKRKLFEHVAHNIFNIFVSNVMEKTKLNAIKPYRLLNATAKGFALSSGQSGRILFSNIPSLSH